MLLTIIKQGSALIVHIALSLNTCTYQYYKNIMNTLLDFFFKLWNYMYIHYIMIVVVVFKPYHM